ncbi:MAG: hypothetical protein PHT60_04760 [Acidiphilium sp.]|nr:hypothetical protein [Acidiphilium sp.]MDD4935073.1 hypothetical protein [Acidiphilium sp.]
MIKKSAVTALVLVGVTVCFTHFAHADGDDGDGGPIISFGFVPPPPVYYAPPPPPPYYAPPPPPAYYAPPPGYYAPPPGYWGRNGQGDDDDRGDDD